MTDTGDAAGSLADALSGELTDGFQSVINMGGPLTQSLSKVGTALAGGNVALAATVTGLTAFVAAMGVATVATANAGSEIYDLSRVTNLSAESLSGLSVAAELGGQSLETLANAFVRLRGQ